MGVAACGSLMPVPLGTRNRFSYLDESSVVCDWSYLFFKERKKEKRQIQILETSELGYLSPLRGPPWGHWIFGPGDFNHLPVLTRECCCQLPVKKKIIELNFYMLPLGFYLSSLWASCLALILTLPLRFLFGHCTPEPWGFCLPTWKIMSSNCRKDIPVFVAEEMRKFYAALNWEGGITVAAALVPMKYREKL